MPNGLIERGEVKILNYAKSDSVWQREFSKNVKSQPFLRESMYIYCKIAQNRQQIQVQQS